MQNLFISFFEFVRNFTKGHEWKIYGIFLAIFIASLFTVIDPFLLKILIDKVTNRGKLRSPPKVYDLEISLYNLSR